VFRWRAGRFAPDLLLAGALACGGTEAEPPPDPLGCATSADCGEQQFCQANVCVQRISLTSISAGRDACSVMSCPDSDPDCCSGAAASATGNEHQDFTSQLHMLEYVGSTGGEVRAEFRFDASNQQGWVSFALGAELDLSKLEITGVRSGVSGRVLSVNTRQLDTVGCAFAFELDDANGSEGSAEPVQDVAEVELTDGEFCYGDGRPGRARELAFAIFSTEPGVASLVISNITLTAH
jgi:hypothetical protein